MELQGAVAVTISFETCLSSSVKTKDFFLVAWVFLKETTQNCGYVPFL